jgi:dihydromonapterin reductase/dihydrofolate reductase
MRSPILITGANRRAGRALCDSLLEAGHEVLAVYRSDPGGLLEFQHPALYRFQADIANAGERERLIEFASQTSHGVRALIHNASLWLDDSPGNLARVLSVHVEAPYHLNQALEAQLKRAGRADIIHICDDTASRGTQNHIAYAASKAALLNLNLSFAEKFAPHIRVNAISPGLLQLKDDHTEGYRQKTLRKAMLEFEPGHAPLLEAVHYLLSASYSTGSNIVINGGRHLRRPGQE